MVVTNSGVWNMRQEANAEILREGELADVIRPIHWGLEKANSADVS